MDNNILCKIHTVVVHGGNFHADDLFTVAYLLKYFDFIGVPVTYKRTFQITDEMTLENGYIVVDIGLGEFDHHQKEELKQKRANGTAYAAFGLVVKTFHDTYLSEEEYQMLDKIFIEDLDRHDNYGTPNHLSLAIGSFNMNWDKDIDQKLQKQLDRKKPTANPNETYTFEDSLKRTRYFSLHDGEWEEMFYQKNDDDRFAYALIVATNILDKMIDNVKASIRAKKLINMSDAENRVLHLKKWAPVEEFLTDNDSIDFLGFWNTRGSYSILSIRDKYGKNKKLFPEKFRGFSSKTPNEYGMLFCHASGFIASFVDDTIAKHFMENYTF